MDTTAVTADEPGAALAPMNFLDTRCPRCRLPKSVYHCCWCPPCHVLAVADLSARVNAGRLCHNPPESYARGIPRPGTAVRFKGKKRGRAAFVTGSRPTEASG